MQCCGDEDRGVGEVEEEATAGSKGQCGNALHVIGCCYTEFWSKPEKDANGQVSLLVLLHLSRFLQNILVSQHAMLPKIAFVVLCPLVSVPCSGS